MMNNYQNDNRNPTVYDKPIIPISDGLKKNLESPHANFSLCSPRLVAWNLKNDKIETSKTAIKDLYDLAGKQLSETSDYINKIQDNQNKILKDMAALGVRCKTIYAQLVSPFITGLGSGHPTETGMILDRNTGVPYLPASSIKGVLRLAYAVNKADGQTSVDSSVVARYFGNDSSADKDKRGEIVFLDAYPNAVPELKCDIMNPHYSKYYNGKKTENPLPEETDAPLPIKFIAVKEGVCFVFRYFFLPVQGNTFDDTDADEIEKAFATAFTVIGFGGKTTIGYGRFKVQDKEKAELAAERKASEQKSNAEAASRKSLEVGKIYEAVLTEQNKKGTWKAEIQQSGAKGSITNSVTITDKKAGDIVTVKVKSILDSGVNMEYVP